MSFQISIDLQWTRSTTTRNQSHIERITSAGGGRGDARSGATEYKKKKKKIYPFTRFDKVTL